MKNVIIITSPSVEVFSTLVALCKEKKVPYHSIKMLDFPIFINGFEIHKKQIRR
jgi:hypothetical protein